MTFEEIDMDMNQAHIRTKTNDVSETTRKTPAADGHAADGRDAATMLPPVDVIEDAAGITVFADLPGVSKEALDVRVEADTLLIEGDITIQIPNDMVASRAEVEVTRYRRQFTLSKELDSAKVDASLNHGVLRIRIPKAAGAQPRRVAVEVR
jgi:HSP20 family protein